MIPLRTAVADDEPLARERMARLLSEAGCEVLAVLEDGLALIAWMATRPKVDALFLDIRMPGLTGLEALAELRDPPMVVFVTAHVGYAVQAFEAAAVDYLLKPVYEDRLARTLQRLDARLVRRLTPAEWKAVVPPLQRVKIKAGTGWVFLDLQHITHFELEDEQVWASGPDLHSQTAWTTLKDVEEAFPQAGMLRIQRHLLLRPEAVVGFRPSLGGRIKVRLAKGLELNVSRTMVAGVMARIGPG